jgi:hypothetical protein
MKCRHAARRRFDSRSMFTEILKTQANFSETDLSKFIYYLERHIELDADRTRTHGHKKMITELCGTEQKMVRCIAPFENVLTSLGCYRRTINSEKC